MRSPGTDDCKVEESGCGSRELLELPTLDALSQRLTPILPPRPAIGFNLLARLSPLVRAARAVANNQPPRSFTAEVSGLNDP